MIAIPQAFFCRPGSTRRQREGERLHVGDELGKRRRNDAPKRKRRSRSNTFSRRNLHLCVASTRGCQSETERHAAKEPQNDTYTYMYTWSMPNKTLYVKDADLPLFEQAQEQLGDSVSSMFGYSCASAWPFLHQRKAGSWN